MNKHPKSQIFEYISKNDNLEPPLDEFDQTFIKSTNIKQFICTLSTTFNGKPKIIKGNMFNNKKDAEKDAYQKLLDIITENPGEKSDPCGSDPKSSDQYYHDKLIDSLNQLDLKRFEPDRCKAKIVVIVDHENISASGEILKLKSFVEKQEKTKFQIIKIAGYCSSVKKTTDIVVRSNRRDAVDHYISYYVGRLEQLLDHNKTKIHVLTRDRFGSCLQDFCENVEHNVDVDDFIESIKGKRNLHSYSIK